MSRKPLVAANWKMNGSTAANAAWIESFLPRVGSLKCDVVVCSPAIYVPQLAAAFKGTVVGFGGEDVSEYDHGAYTGETAASMLVDIGAGWVLTGHSERRTYFGDTDARVAAKTKAAVEKGLKPIVCIGETLAEREAGKTIEVANGIWQRLGEEGFTRSDAIVGLGGGAATDLAGFVAATWMRGIRYVNCPTSLLAMVDASTGGKTGINTPQGKNLVGSFYTPAGVLADMGALASLPNDIFIEGLGEVAKSGFIMDPEILRMLEDHADELRSFDGSTFLDSDLKDVVAELIERTVTVKAYHVSADLKEAGLREFLNYGHTMGHAIEKLEHFRWRHGNAVAVGMVYAAELAHLIGYIDQDLVDYHRSLLASMGLPTSWNGGSFDDVLALMHRDKKARGNELRFVVLDEIGHVVHLDNPPAEAVEEAFRRIQQ